MRGNFEEIPFEQVLASIEKNKRTGTLTITLKMSTVTIYFIKGLISNVESTGVKRFLGAILVRSGVLSRKQLAEALDYQQKRFLPLGELLIEKNILDRQELLQMLEFQAYDLLYSLFMNNSGQFIFFKSKCHLAGGDTIFFSINVFHLIKKGIEIRSSINEACQLVHSERLVFEQLPRSGALLEKEMQSLTDDEKRLYPFIDGLKSVGHMSVSSFLGTHRTKKAIWGLFQRGLIKKSKVLLYFDRQRRVTSEDESQLHIPLETLPIILVNIFVVSLLILILAYAKINPISLLKVMVYNPSQYGKVSEYLADFQKEKIHYYLWVYYLDKGHYPESLEQLVELKHGFLKVTDMDYPWEKPYFYQRKESGYLLLSPKD